LPLQLARENKTQLKKTKYEVYVSVSRLTPP
jgi:hypothetical protein